MLFEENLLSFFFHFFFNLLSNLMVRVYYDGLECADDDNLSMQCGQNVFNYM